MSTVKGYPSQKKDGPGQYATVEPVASEQYGQSIRSYGYTKLVATDAAEAGSTTLSIVATAHSAKVGDTILFTSGAADGQEAAVISVEANAIGLGRALPVAPSATDTFEILRFATPRVNDDHTLAVTIAAAPIQFVKDGVDTEVLEDTVDPSNNAPLPVKLTSVTGDINITAGDLNVQLSHAGASYDSTRIGDGTNLLAITAAGEAEVSLMTAIPAGSNNIGSVNAVQSGTWTVDVNASSLPSGAATEATLAGLAAEDFATETTLAQLASEDFATETTLALIEGKIATVDTDNVTVVSSALPTGAATEATLAALDAKVTAVNTGAVTISSALPAGTNNIGDVDVLSLPALPAGTNNIGDVDVLSLPSIPAGTNNIGDVDVVSLPALDVVDLLDTPLLDASSTNIPASGGSFLEVVASTAAAVKKLQILDTTGGYIGLYTGASSSEVLKLIIGPGSDQTIDVTIASGVRISLRSMSSAITVGNLAINFIG